MSDWPGNDGKMTSYSNSKLKFFERSCKLVRGFYFEFCCDLRSLASMGTHLFKIPHCKTRNIGLPGQ